MRLTRWVGFSAVVLFSACRGDSARNESNVPVDSTVRTASDSPHIQIVNKSPYGISGDTVGPGFKVAAEFTKDTLLLTPTEIPAGEFTLTAQNKTKKVHRLEIKGTYGGRFRTMKIPPDGAVAINGTFVQGPYEAYDPDLKKGPYRAKLVVK